MAFDSQCKFILLVIVFGLVQAIPSPSLKYHVPPFRANWFKAQEYCHTLGMALVTIDSRAKNVEVASFITTTEPRNKYNYWIGGTDLAKKFTFSWVATGGPFGYTNWSANEPNNANGIEDCVHIVNQPQLNQFWTWNDHRCAEQFDFICERSGRCY